MRRLKQIWLFEDTVSLIDQNINNGHSRAFFIDKLVKHGLWYDKNVAVEIIPEKKWGRPRKNTIINTL